MADYKIELGVKLDTSDIQTQINAAGKNVKPIEIKIDAETKELTNTIKDALKSLSTGTKNALTLDTSKLEGSLAEVKNAVIEIKNLFGTIDDKSGMKSLLSSVNQIAATIGRVTDETDALVKSLNALSKKEFNINLGIDMGKKNLSTVGYGRAARKQVIPELESQIKELENLFGGQQATMSKLSKQGKNVGFDIFTDFGDFNSDSAIKKMEAMEKYINSLKKLAAMDDSINLDGFNEKFSKGATELINDITGVENAVDKAGDVPEKLKNLFGGSIDGEGLSKQLDSIVIDLGEIKTVVQGLSSGISFEGLTQSFDRLSDTIEKLVQNCTTAKKAINDSLGSLGGSTGSADSGLTKVGNDLRQITSVAENTAKAMQYVREVLSAKDISNTNIDKVTEDLKKLGIEISNVTTRTTKNGLNISVKGIDDLGRAVTVVRQFDKDFKGETIAKSFDTSADAAKRWKKEVSNAYQDVKKVTQQIGGLEVELIGAKAKNDVKEINRINSRLDVLRKKLGDIKGVYGKDFTTRHNNLLKGLEDDIADKKLKAQIDVDNKAELQSITSDFEKLKSLAKEISNLRIDILNSDDASDISKAKTELDSLSKEYDELFAKTKGSLNGKQLSQLDNLVNQGDTKVLREFNNELNEFVKLQNQIENTQFEIGKLEVSGGKDNEIETLKRQLEELEDAYNRLMNTFMKKASANGDIIHLGDFKSLENGITEATKNAENRLERFKSQYADTRAELARKIKVDIELGNFDDDVSRMQDKFDKLSHASKDLYTSVEAVNNALTEMKNASKPNDDGVVDTERLIKAQQDYARAIETTNNLIDKQYRKEAADARNQKLIDDSQVFQSKIDTWLTKNSAATKQFGAAMLDLKAKAENCDRVTLNHLESQFKKLDNAAEKAGVKMMSLGDQIKSKFKEYMAYFSVAEVFMYVEQGLREMFNTVKEIDTAMTGLYRVTDLTASQYDSLFNDMISSAKEYGATLNDIINATTDWVRAGFEADTALGLAEVTTMYQHISDLDYDTAAENLITAYNGFKDELNGAFDGDQVAAVNYIADIFNELDNNFAVTSAGLGEALTRSASALDLAGNTIQETAGMITGITEVTQDPEKAGSALKILSLRLRGKRIMPPYKESLYALLRFQNNLSIEDNYICQNARVA